MPELGSSGSVRGARGNPRSYRDKSADEPPEPYSSSEVQIS
jgi:hypothetical protein